ncbi:recombinase family protein [Afipia carboxidovorans]|nr:recombinase family protein [Afipia carboxidovorans]
MSSTINRFVAYYRVSTTKQGASGLGLAAQRSAVAAYLKKHGQIIAEFKEIESGRRSDRPALEQALAAARVHRVPIVVAKVDRLTRSVGFLSRLLESGVEVCFADLPAIEGPTGRFMLQQMAAVAELEAGLISTRTKAALAAAKKRGVRLGGFRGGSISKAAHQASKAARGRIATQRALDLAPTLKELQSEGMTSHEQLARALTDRRIPTSRGHTKWTGVQVERVLRRAATLDTGVPRPP